MSLPDGSGGPHAIVDDVDAPLLSDDDRHHLERSLRLRVGDPLTVTDSRGSWRQCRLAAGLLELAGERVDVPRPVPALTVGVALAKASKPDLVIQKLTELGIDHIIVFESDHSVARWTSERLPRLQQRYERIVAEALMQSRGVWKPSLAIGQDSDAVLASLSGAAVRADRGGRRLEPADTTVLIGPEGGWSSRERDAVPEAVGLNPQVLRAETAALAAATLMAAHRGVGGS